MSGVYEISVSVFEGRHFPRDDAYRVLAVFNDEQKYTVRQGGGRFGDSEGFNGAQTQTTARKRTKFSGEIISYRTACSSVFSVLFERLHRHGIPRATHLLTTTPCSSPLNNGCPEHVSSFGIIPRIQVSCA